jgi:hypothetical protein
MCSITPPHDGPATAAALGAAIAHLDQLARAVATVLGDAHRFDLGALPPDVAAATTTTFLRIADRVNASASVTAGHVTATTGPATGTLIAGKYASPRRWLEVDAGLAPLSAKAVLARARDLREHSEPVLQAWLAGEVSGDAVRALTSGVSGVLAGLTTTREEKARLRGEALDILMPLAKVGTVADVKKAVHRLRLLADSAYDDPERAAARTQSAVESYDDQRLTCHQVGDHSILAAVLTHESAAAAMTVIDQYASRIADGDPDVTHDPTCPLATVGATATSTSASVLPPPSTSVAPVTSTAMSAADGPAAWCTCGASAAAGVVSKGNYPHLRAVAFGELMTGMLDDARVGSHHGIAPHVTLTVDLDRLLAGLGGDLTMPGSDDSIVIGSRTVHRILCDASITPVIVRRPASPPFCGGEPRSPGDELADLLLSESVEVLYVGRAERTVPPRLRRALEARDQHCVFPGCRAHPRRCHAHHIREWEHGGTTDLDNCALLCVRHHHAVHEGGWTITRTPSTTAHQSGCWTFTPPRPQP